MKSRRAGLALLLATLSACSGQDVAERPVASAGEIARHPVSGLEVVPLTVNTGTAQHRFDVEIARTPEQQRRGLMFREELAPDEGMIFPYNPPTAQGFWMKDTPLSLDIIFVGPDGRIINIAANTTPYSEESVYSQGPASLVLEIPGGRAAELGIEPGDEVRW
jgi:uncharacterized membrane protein (UPF0127 family)